MLSVPAGVLARGQDGEEAARAEIAERMAQVQVLKSQVGRDTARVELMKRQLELLAGESSAKYHMNDALRGRLSEYAGALSASAAFADTSAAKHETLEAKQHAAYVARFEATLTHTLGVHRQQAELRRQERVRGVAVAALGTLPQLARVHLCAGGEPAEETQSSAVFRLGVSSTFRDLRANVARYWSLSADDWLLEDERRAQWVRAHLRGTIAQMHHLAYAATAARMPRPRTPHARPPARPCAPAPPQPLEVEVMREVMRFRGDQTIRMVKRVVEEQGLAAASVGSEAYLTVRIVLGTLALTAIGPFALARSSRRVRSLLPTRRCA